jgi:hypothetical protein
LKNSKYLKMKTLYALVCLLFISVSLNAQVGIGTNTPDASSMLEVKSTTKGFLPPRVSLVATESASPITSPATGLVVYNTATTAYVLTGIYYWNGTVWKKLDVDTRSSQFTTSGSNVYYTTGNLGIGTTTPATTLDVNGSATVSGSLNGGNSATSTISGFVANFSTKTTSYTLVAADNGKILNFTNSTAVTLTIPSGLPTGFNCTIVQNGTGQITLAASSTTINNRNGFTKTAGQYSMVSILHLGSNVFISSGEMSN